ncbi:MAG: helix-turn-helix domain-containing protein [Gaiellaceae bacterium]
MTTTVDPARKNAISANGLPSFLTVDEVAAVLRCQPEKIYRLAARGVLPSYKIEGRRLFDPADIAAFLSTCREGPNLSRNGRR